MKQATFFGGALRDTETKEYLDSVKMGRLLADNGYNIKNGGYFGLMEAVSKGASESENNVNIVGYTCKTYTSAIGNAFLTECIACDDIYSRLRQLISNSDVFVVQKGGIGTLSELFLVLDEVRKQKVKPRIFLIGNMYSDLIESIKPVLTAKDLKMFTICKDYKDFKNKF